MMIENRFGSDPVAHEPAATLFVAQLVDQLGEGRVF